MRKPTRMRVMPPKKRDKRPKPPKPYNPDTDFADGWLTRWILHFAATDPTYRARYINTSSISATLARHRKKSAAVQAAKRKEKKKSGDQRQGS